MQIKLSNTICYLFLVGFIAGCNDSKALIKAKANSLVQKAGDSVAVEAMETEVLKLFEKSCFECHGKNGANAGNMGNILDVSSLKDRQLMVPNSLENSKLYQRMMSTKQPMPPSGKLPQSDIDLVGKWIMEYGKSQRSFMPYSDVYKLVEKDLSLQADKVNTRYFHLVNLYNSGAPDAEIQNTRNGLSKMLNMLSTSDKISVPEAIDDKLLIYRVDLKKYDLHRPETLYTYMLKNIFPKLSDDLKTKWLPNIDERNPANYYGGRFKELFEGKGSVSPFLKSGIHTFKDGLPFSNDPSLLKMAKEMREASQKIPSGLLAYGDVSQEESQDSMKCRTEDNPAGISCSSPIPLMRANWFIAQVSANMKMRLYYHGAGMDDDTVTLDAALGIDDVEGFLNDNDPNYVRPASKEPLIRAGFNNSGVSINHRSIERIPLDYVPGKPLWRGYEFLDKSLPGKQEYDIFEYPVGPFFDISVKDELGSYEPGFECVNLMSKPYFELPRINSQQTDRVRLIRLMDLGLLYPSSLPGEAEPRIVKEIKAIAPQSGSVIPPGKQARYNELLIEFKALYKHEDYLNYKSVDYILAHGGSLPTIDAANLQEIGRLDSNPRKMVQCEAPTDIKPFRHESLEYLFLKRNGMQGFVNVGLKAEHLDYKIPNQRAIENKQAILIPAHDNPNQLVVGAPISCLSCHVKGYIEKQDMVKNYVDQSNASDAVKNKISKVHVDLAEFRAQMEKDNAVFREALHKTGVLDTDEEPIVANYRSWAIPGLSLGQVASELELTGEALATLIKSDLEVGFLLRELKIKGSTIKRSDFERAYFPLMCKIYKHCVTVPKENIIPAQ